ncbi:MAG: AAA family ATPase [Haloglomus sp.]
MRESNDIPNGEEGIFSSLIGHEGAKLVLRTALRQGDVDIMLVGPPASGKSVALLAIEENVPGSVYRDASGFTQAKLRDVLAEDPEILALDEADAMNNNAFSALNTAMEDGFVSKSTMTESYKKEVDTQIFATSNSLDAIPEDIRSRFRVIEFEEYSPNEYLDVCEKLLLDVIDWIQQGQDARQVAQLVYDAIGSRDPRDARDVARLAGALGNPLSRVKDIAKSLEDPNADVESVPLTKEELIEARELGRTQDPKASVDPNTCTANPDEVGRKSVSEIAEEMGVSPDELGQDISEGLDGEETTEDDGGDDSGAAAGDGYEAQSPASSDAEMAERWINTMEERGQKVMANDLDHSAVEIITPKYAKEETKEVINTFKTQADAPGVVPQSPSFKDEEPEVAETVWSYQFYLEDPRQLGSSGYDFEAIINKLQKEDIPFVVTKSNLTNISIPI